MNKYLELLDPEAEKFLFACFDYRKIKKGRTIYGPFQDSIKRLTELNDESYCVYVTVNETKAAKRDFDSIIRARAVWVEDDNVVDKPRDDFPIKPSMIVESSKGKFHYYWLTSTKKIDEWDAVMATMVNKWGCDNKAKDRARVLRLPGFKHNKDLSNPFETKLVYYSDQRYSWLEIKSVFPPEKKEEKTEKTTGNYSEKATLDALLSSENYHGSLTSIAMSLANRNVSRELQYTTLYGLMCAIPENKRRPEWEARASKEHLYECIDSAIKKVKDEEESVILQDVQDIEMSERLITFPPGLAGQLCEEILEMAQYKNRAIALAGAMSLIAGITGRRYNVRGMGLNLYVAILADSGIGKANLKDSINRALRGSPLNMGSTFIGKSRFTGPKAIFDMLSTGLSRVCVIEEAGLMNQDGPGDQAGIARATLDLFTSSGMGKWAGDEGYSSKDNSIPAIHSPALTIVSVSTPKSFLRTLKSKSADVSGEVARLWMIRTNSLKPYINPDPRPAYSKETATRIAQLVKDCLPYQLPEAQLEVKNITYKDEFLKDSEKWIDLENKYILEGDHLRRTVCSRAWAKILKLASVASVFNGKEHIGDDEYSWAASCVEDELGFIQETFTHESSDELVNVAKNVVYPAIVKIIMGLYGDCAKTPNEDMRKAGIFSPTNLSQALSANRVVRELDDNPDRPNPKTGIEKIIEYMVRNGLLVKMDQIKMAKYSKRVKIGYQVTEDFKMFFCEPTRK